MLMNNWQSICLWTNGLTTKELAKKHLNIMEFNYDISQLRMNIECCFSHLIQNIMICHWQIVKEPLNCRRVKSSLNFIFQNKMLRCWWIWSSNSHLCLTLDSPDFCPISQEMCPWLPVQFPVTYHRVLEFITQRDVVLWQNLKKVHNQEITQWSFKFCTLINMYITQCTMFTLFGAATKWFLQRRCNLLLFMIGETWHPIFSILYQL